MQSRKLRRHWAIGFLSASLVPESGGFPCRAATRGAHVSYACQACNRLMLMSQEPDEQMNQPGPEEPMIRPPLYRPSVPFVSSSSRKHAFSQPVRDAPPEQEERMRRLRELRRQRQQSSYDETSPPTFQRRGLPTPPPAQPSFQEAIKHWWRNGPFANPLSVPEEREKINTPGPVPTKPFPPRSPLEQRSRAWLAKGRSGVARLSVQTRNMLLQMMNLFKQRAISAQRPDEATEIVPGLIVVSFAPGVTRQDAVRQIGALGGKPLRYRTSTNSYQVAVPPGQEEALIQQYRQIPGVILADLERSSGRS